MLYFGPNTGHELRAQENKTNKFFVRSFNFQEQTGIVEFRRKWFLSQHKFDEMQILCRK